MLNGSRYEFVTKWNIPAPKERVWEELINSEQWPSWWRGVERVELMRPGVDSLGTGAIRHYTWRSRLPYRLTFTMETTFIEPYATIKGQATGELEGFGCWTLSEASGGTHVQYDWHVIANNCEVSLGLFFDQIPDRDEPQQCRAALADARKVTARIDVTAILARQDVGVGTWSEVWAFP